MIRQGRAVKGFYKKVRCNKIKQSTTYITSWQNKKRGELYVK